MEILFDETFASEDGKRASRNIWYGYAELSTDGAYGKDISLTGDLLDTLSETIRRDLIGGTADRTPTETNWYFYGKDSAEDAVGDSVRPSIMVRERAGQFVTHINISDHDFALSIDAVLAFQRELDSRLARG